MADLEKTIKRFQLFADEAKHRGIVEVPDDIILDALALLKEQQQIVHCPDCLYNKNCISTENGIDPEGFCKWGKRDETWSVRIRN